MKRALLAMAAVIALSGCGDFVPPSLHPVMMYQPPAPPALTPALRQQEARKQLANIRASQEMYDCQDQYQYSMSQTSDLSIEHEAQPKIYPSVSDYMQIVSNELQRCVQNVYRRVRAASD